MWFVLLMLKTSKNKLNRSTTLENFLTMATEIHTSISSECPAAPSHPQVVNVAIFLIFTVFAWLLVNSVTTFSYQSLRHAPILQLGPVYLWLRVSLLWCSSFYACHLERATYHTLLLHGFLRMHFKCELQPKNGYAQILISSSYWLIFNKSTVKFYLGGCFNSLFFVGDIASISMM